ncbi:hypothetical protein FGU71_01500 [Erythrobacter insulae]|uniref:Uncharacterized protein n=1 Tax=Erythrobacter insulae TaxID=2584124 RepID=A0A547P956_9SPHN|nr:DUF6768 family protein [Erythrobacter insulae]TRD10669.1 hypothetical protein FGU71_01500 [Erythrobacter insulae]
MMTDIDDRIKDALNDDDFEFLKTLEGDRGLFQQIGDTWKGPLGGWSKLIFAFTVIMGLVFVFVIWQVAHSTNEPIVHALWAISGVALLVMIGFAKEWMFARMNMLTILREVKKLQVQVAILSEKQD